MNGLFLVGLVCLVGGGALALSLLFPPAERSKRWHDDADYAYDAHLACHPLFGLLGADEWGDWLMPLGHVHAPDGSVPYWDGLFNPWNPTHWPPYLRSRITGRFIYLETYHP